MPHIKVELDFIPVEERLPEDDTLVYVIGCPGQKKMISHDFTMNGRWISSGKWTHWAEIPEIE